MSSFEKHCSESLTLFGRIFGEVHRWLDEFAGSKECGFRHRHKRHHEAGIKLVIEIFGEEAGQAARLHITSDLKEEGWTENDHFPRDEKDYIAMGLY